MLQCFPFAHILWCDGRKIGSSGASSGGSGDVAQEVYRPYYFEGLDQIDNSDGDEEEIDEYNGSTGVTATSIVSSGTYKLRLESNFDAPNASAVNGADNTVVAFYSYIIFKEPNFLNGEGF